MYFTKEYFYSCIHRHVVFSSLQLYFVKFFGFVLISEMLFPELLVSRHVVLYIKLGFVFVFFIIQFVFLIRVFLVLLLWKFNFICMCVCMSMCFLSFTFFFTLVVVSEPAFTCQGHPPKVLIFRLFKIFFVETILPEISLPALTVKVLSVIF